MNDVTTPMILALADLHNDPVQIAGSGVDPAHWVNTNTRRALIRRGLAEVWTGRTYRTAVCSDHPVHPGESKWLEITRPGRLVVSAYNLGSDTIDLALTAGNGR